MEKARLKQALAKAALPYVQDKAVIGVGTGSTISYFIEMLATLKGNFTTVASSEKTKAQLTALGISVSEFNHVDEISIYVDSADACNAHFQLIKGKGGAFTQEKILASASHTFLCLIDDSKWTPLLNNCPIPIEVLPMARSFVARALVKLGGQPVYRENVVTDNGNVILDVHHLNVLDPPKLELTLNNIPGVMGHGLFTQNRPATVLMATSSGIQTLSLTSR